MSIADVQPFEKISKGFLYFMAKNLKTIKRERKRARGWLWDGMLKEESVNILVAAQSSGKSMLALGLIKEMLKSQRGQAFLGRGVRACRVLYISTEMAADSIASRLADLGVDGRMAGARNRFFVYENSALTVADIEREVEECNPDLVVVDILGGLIVGEGLEINSYDAFNTVIPRLRRFNKTFLLIHHLNKQNKAMGSIGALSAMDTRMEMTVTERESDGDGNHVIYQNLHVYGKDVPEQYIDVAFKYPTFEISEAEEIEEIDKPLSKLMQSVVLAENDGLEGTYQQIAAKCQLLERYQFNPKRLGSLLRMNAEVLKNNKIFYETRKIGGVYKLKIWYDPADDADEEPEDLTVGGILHPIDDNEQIDLFDLTEGEEL